ncbi:MAG: hypothetical protein PHR36_01605 [Patescibacteria group bacterium]|nr:hypothetical protein [Patescibacteria group bacterium]
MTKKLLNFIIITIAIAALAGIIYIIFFHDFTGKNLISGEKKVSSPSAETEGEGVIVLSSENQKDLSAGGEGISESEIVRESLKRMAIAFAERFGSYSNHSNYSNISDLKVFMTGAMQVWADRFIEETKAERGTSDVYYGITTKAIASEIKEIDESAGQAEILVKAQKREASGTMDNTAVTYQDILISFAKENSFWKVDRAEWQEK